MCSARIDFSRKFYIMENEIEDEGTLAIASALHHNKSLKILYTDQRSKVGGVANRVASMLQSTTVLREFHFSHGDLTKRSRKTFYRAMQHNRVL
mmetsp:Transcript_28370/g.65840  ORF Transcript_28370/g.65840 Transcript_28370/m.65840 type:complete len:94 (+) Transcript_28370:95-376(+)